MFSASGDGQGFFGWGGGFYSHHRCGRRIGPKMGSRSNGCEMRRLVKLGLGNPNWKPKYLGFLVGSGPVLISSSYYELSAGDDDDLLSVIESFKRLNKLLMSSSHYELSLERNKQKKLEKKLLNEDDHAVHLLIPMIGSVIFTKPDQITQRILPEDAIEHIHLLNSMIGFTKPNQIIQRTLPEDAIEHIHLLNSMIGSVQPDQITQRTLPEDAIEHIHLLNSMIGSVQPDQITQRTLPEDAIEQIHFSVNVWTKISQHLFDVEPEFVDSKYFHATTLKRVIFIILPINNRFSLILLPPCADVFPLTKK
ncbi:hypothetical protein F3Y22_tig00003041pilonHSYRG01067 [Hibiscus syriacus]|uniref:Uncharacterized protein n=1 Tax=Hibiscus syriacus TaxID=106335 RepID=A0A6A3CL92_HIBSY|nr:hypothetical protein F3Y22_tig00003041pilonHSYRG01067 [Hibiscus syriacus]